MTETLVRDCEPKPCPFCGASLKHVESLACSFSPPRTYHEFQHPKNDCLYSGTRYGFTDDSDPRTDWVERWNRRAPSPPPAAPCADEVEVVARAFCVMSGSDPEYMGDTVPAWQAWTEEAEAAIAALSPLRQAERERAWREGAEATRSALAAYAEARGATKLADAMRAFPLPPMGGV